MVPEQRSSVNHVTRVYGPLIVGLTKGWICQSQYELTGQRKRLRCVMQRKTALVSNSFCDSLLNDGWKVTVNGIWTVADVRVAVDLNEKFVLSRFKINSVRSIPECVE
jgi:hypothetical protein